MKTLFKERTVGELVAEQPARSKVFERLGIDYCCGGQKTLADACAARALNVETVLNALAESDAVAATPHMDWTQATLTQLTHHIEETHHAYLREVLPRLTSLAQQVADAHGANDARLVELRNVFSDFRSELEAHMAKEEYVLFPMCRQLEGATTLPRFHCGTVRNPIAVMRAEHDDAGEALAAMRSLTDDFTPPEEACNTYRAMLQALAELEADMHEHVHVENNILFPKAVSAEARLS